MQMARSLRQHRDRAATNWAARGPVVVAAGVPPPIEGTDQVHDFHTHPDYAYLAGPAAPGSTLTFDPGEGWVLFVPVASAEDRVWSGDSEAVAVVAQRTGLEAVRPASELASWFERRRGEGFAFLGNPDLWRHPAAYAAPSVGSLELSADADESERLTAVLAELRRTKDAHELGLMREAVAASAAGHIHALRSVRPGMSERAIQVELEAEFFRNGAMRTAYGSIVGSGPNGAILHFAPSRRVVADGDLVLIDAGAEIGDYASDVTRTFPASGRFVGAQRDIYGLVLAVQQRAIAHARPGKEYRELHLEASEQLAAGLADLGILRGPGASLVEQDAHALFFPHGLGHMLGLSTHDVGGCLAGRTPSDRFGLKWLRADLPLEPGYVVTIEPGIYFVRALLEDPMRRERFRDVVNWELVDTLLDFGGIRIEDDVLITDGDAEVLSRAIPTGIAEIEALREEARS